MAVTKQFSQAILTGATFNAADGWQWEQPPGPARLEVLARATAVGLLCTITSGGDTIMEESPIQAGGTAGTTPARLNTEPMTGSARGNLRIKVNFRNPTGGTITVDGILTLIPTGGPGRGR